MWSDLPCQSFESVEAMKAALPTPCALVDVAIVRSNIALLNERIQRLGSGVRFRPHVKTHKSADLARLQIEGHFGGITVSTIAEAKYFFARGFRDILYAVGMVGSKVARVADDIKAGLQLSVIVDHVDAVKAIASECVKHGVSLDVLVEVDCGYYRGGLNPASADLLDVGRAIHASSPSLRLRGVLTHGGHSYNAKSVEALEAIANAERDSVVLAAQRLREAGLPCEVTSIGSTPTATYLKDATGITELRAGVYVFQDLDQMGIGSCSSTSDIALTVLTAVIGHQPPAGKVLVDAGGLALSKDISAKQHCGYHAGYGWIIEHPEMHVAAVSQEHGHLQLRPSDDEEGATAVDFTKYPIGATMRVVPNHSCFTAAAYDRYFAYVVNPDATVTVWKVERVNGW